MTAMDDLNNIVESLRALEAELKQAVDGKTAALSYVRGCLALYDKNHTPDEIHSECICLYCGKVFKPVKPSRRKVKFCCKYHNDLYLQQRNRSPNQVKPTHDEPSEYTPDGQKSCVRCNKLFTPSYNGNQIYCSKRCNNAYALKRKKEKEKLRPKPVIEPMAEMLPPPPPPLPSPPPPPTTLPPPEPEQPVPLPDPPDPLKEKLDRIRATCPTPKKRPEFNRDF